MSNLKSLIQSLSAVALWLMTAGIAFAQATPPAGTAASGDGDSMAYMLPYAVVILGMIGGVAIVARSSSRRERERPAGYVQKSVMEDE